MDNERTKLMEAVMAADFAVIEMNLYLNTHPYDARAIAIMHEAARRSSYLHSRYESLYGPLFAANASGGMPWPWIRNPWPWDYSGS